MVGTSFVKPTKMLTIAEAAERAGVDAKTIKRAIRSKELLARRAGMRTLVPLPALSLWQAHYWGAIGAEN